MTQQDDITQRVPMAEEILGAIRSAGYRDHPTNIERKRVDAILSAVGPLLSKLRATVSSIREGFELTYAADADDPACASDLSHFTNGWRACVMSQLRAPVAAPSNETLRLAGVIADKIEDGTLFQAGIFSRRELADKVRAVVRFVREASTPEAGEAVYTLRVSGAIQAWTPTAAAFSIPDGEHQLFLRPAAPQASAEIGVEDAFAGLDSILEVRNAALDEAIQAISRITTSYATFTSGNPLYRPESRPASAAIAEAIDTILALKTQADKDGGQQRAGDECKHARAYRAGDRQGYACPDCGEFVSDYEIHRRQRAALSAPQAEQGERDA